MTLVRSRGKFCRLAGVLTITSIVASTESIAVSGTDGVPEMAGVIWIIPPAVACILSASVVTVVVALAFRDFIRTSIVAWGVPIVVVIRTVWVKPRIRVHSRVRIKSRKYQDSRGPVHETTAAPVPALSLRGRSGDGSTAHQHEQNNNNRQHWLNSHTRFHVYHLLASLCLDCGLAGKGGLNCSAAEFSVDIDLRQMKTAFVFRGYCASLARVITRTPSADRNEGNQNGDPMEESPQPSCVGELPGFPFETFEQLQAAVAIRSFNLGVDALAAAQWSERFNSRAKRFVVNVLSLLLIGAAASAAIAAFVTFDYWLLAALPIQALAFYLSHPASPMRKWVTIGGAISVAVFLNLLLNGLLIAATLVAYAGLTFAAVRAAGYITNSAFRKALLSDEALFLEVYGNGACTVRNNQTERVYSA